MSKYTKQLSRKCENPGCLKAFCRQIYDTETLHSVSSILSSYGDSLTCKNIHKLNFNRKQSGNNVFIDALIYMSELMFGKTESISRPTRFNTNARKILGDIHTSTEKLEDHNKIHTTQNLEHRISPCQELSHRYCEIIEKQLSLVDLYLLVGIVHFLLGKFQTCPEFNLSLIIIRFFNKIVEFGDIEALQYKTLMEVFEGLAEKVLNSVITCSLKNHKRCQCEKCLFHLDFTREDLVQSTRSIVRLIEETTVTDFRGNLRLSNLFEILGYLYQINQRFYILEECDFVLNRFFRVVNLKNEVKFCRLRSKSPLNYPFAVPIWVKAEVLKIQHGESMKSSLQEAFFRALFQGITHPYLFINIRRDRIYQDTLKVISEIDEIDIKKQLKVKFVGEEGIDSGGIKKEYFLLVGHEIENDIGIFLQTNNRLWFRKGVDLETLYTIGKVVGIALYNDVVVSVPFPCILFKKLLGIPLSFEDLEEIEPEVYNSLKNLDGCTDEDLQFLDQNFTAEVEVLGRRMCFELKENGQNLKVDKSNLGEFVDLYSKFLLERVIEEEFREFSRGFYSVIRFENIQHLRPEELEKIVMGVDSINFEILRETATYKGYDPEDPVVKYFWDFIHKLKPQRRKKLIQFITGNDRLPVGGSESLKLVVMKNGCDTERLPSSQTCFNTLLLPEYSTKEKLEEKLGKAIDMTAGFFLIKTYQNERIYIEAKLENSSEVVSIDECFILDVSKCAETLKLPKTFKVRNDRVFYQTKLTRSSNKLISITCKGDVRFNDLRKFLPTVFDTKIISRINEKEFVLQNYNQIVQMTKSIIGKEEVEAMLNKKIQ